jgi:ParB family chromosome partitioning protein
MPETVSLLSPSRLKRNPENPRLVFHEEELDELESSIRDQGILVPLTVYRDGRTHYLLDGERRWRCALKLGLDRVPVIVQPKPDRLQNLMMMFAIHNAREDWDPLPAALKLEDLEDEFRERQGRDPSENELAQMASVKRGEIRRLRNLLRLPKKYRDELLEELKKPRAQQEISADHVLEATRGAAALEQRDIVNKRDEDRLRRAILKKFRRGVIKSTVDPRKLARIARAVDREDVTLGRARKVTTRLIEEPDYSINDAFSGTVEAADYAYGTEQLTGRVVKRLQEQEKKQSELSDSLRDALEELSKTIRRMLGR